MYTEMDDGKNIQGFLQNSVEVLSDTMQWEDWLAKECKADLKALEEADGFKSCTTIGNGSNKDRLPNVMAVMQAILRADTADLKHRMQEVLEGRVESSEAIREVASMMKAKYVGPFKSYFCGKMLKVSFPAVHVKCIVGPNLEVAGPSFPFIQYPIALLGWGCLVYIGICLLHPQVFRFWGKGFGCFLCVCFLDGKI